MKICPECKEEKEFGQFHKSRSNKSGLATYCKICKSEKDKKYREENKEQLRAKRKEYSSRPDVREASRIRSKMWVKNNRERYKKRMRDYYLNNLEKSKEYSKKWALANRDRMLQRKKDYVAKIHSESVGCVYAIFNTKNDFIYIGETISDVLRWKDHLSRLRGNKHQNYNFQKDYNEFGEEAFEFVILEELPKDKDLLLREEAKMIQKYLNEGKSLYNFGITLEQLQTILEE